MTFYNETARIGQLRQLYEVCPMRTEPGLSYNLCGRQRYLHVKGWSLASGKNSLYRRACAYAYVYENMKPVICDQELIVGQPDYAPLIDEEAREWENLSKYAHMMPSDGGRRDHKSLDFAKLLRLGVDGLLNEIDSYRSGLDALDGRNQDRINFYNCAERELKGLLVLAERYADYALLLAETAEELRKKELLEIAAILRKVPRHPADTFREALQSIHFYSFVLGGLYQCGHPDRYLLPYYENDIRNGILTSLHAQELIDCFCLMYSTYVNSSSSVGFMVGGVDEHGKLVENELTAMFLGSIPHTRSADPSIGFCVTEQTSPQLLGYAAALLAEGYSHPAIYNDTLITKALQKYGVNKADSHNYIHSCCVEITVDKKSDVWVVSPYHNLLQYFLDVLEENPDAASTTDLLEALRSRVRQRIIEHNDWQNLCQLERSHNGGEPALVSCLVEDCLKRGSGIHAGGAVYNWTQPNFLGTANVVESLLTVERLVFREKKLSIRDLLKILQENFAGNEALRREIITKGSHFGVCDEEADRLFQEVTRMIAGGCKEIRNYRGDILIPAMFSYNEHIRYGSRTGASPDGRLQREPLADGSGPVQGRDILGPTAMLCSVTAWDHAPFLGGIAMNLKLQKGDRPEKTAKALEALIRGYLQRGGMELQVTAVNADELEDAMVHPENHRNLLVRVGGYSDYFVTLPPQLQKEILSRNGKVIP